jgi:hypothetical protein
VLFPSFETLASQAPQDEVRATQRGENFEFPDSERRQRPQPFHRTALVWSNPDEVWGRMLHDLQKWEPGFPRDKREAFVRRSCVNKEVDQDAIQPDRILIA